MRFRECRREEEGHSGLGDCLRWRFGRNDLWKPHSRRWRKLVDRNPRCSLKAETRLRANVRNGQRKTYHIEFEGPLDCDGKAIKIEGFLKD